MTTPRHTRSTSNARLAVPLFIGGAKKLFIFIRDPFVDTTGFRRSVPELREFANLHVVGYCLNRNRNLNLNLNLNPAPSLTGLRRIKIKSVVGSATADRDSWPTL